MDVQAALATFGNDKELLSTMISSVCVGYTQTWEPALSKSLRNLEYRRILTIMSVLDVASDTFAGTGFRDAVLDVIDLVADAGKRTIRVISERDATRVAIVDRLEAMHESISLLAYLPIALVSSSAKKVEMPPSVESLAAGKYAPAWRVYLKSDSNSKSTANS